MQESLCEISRWFREEQKLKNGKKTNDEAVASDDDDDDDVDDARSRTRTESASSRDAWTPVHVEPTYGPCQRCYPRNLKFGGHGSSSHVTPPPTPPEERDKFECLYLLVDTAISRMERERGRPWK